MIKVLLILSLALILPACGSLTTITSSDREISANLNKRNTSCESMLRVYSGLSYDLCNLHSNPGGMSFNWILGFYVVDGIASAAVDTVLLPYTGYRQYKDGSIALDVPTSNPK